MWTQGTENEITKAAVEAFETQNNLTVDGIAGPAVWTALINDTINGKSDATPYVYVLVNKALPENLTLWNNGAAEYVGIPVNTGSPGADTTDGSYAVFEHVRYSDMKGTNVDGSTYNDPNVPVCELLQRGRRAARVHPRLLRLAAEQRLRRDELRRRRAGVAADPDRDPRDGRSGPNYGDCAPADDHDDRGPATDRRPRRPPRHLRRHRRRTAPAPPPPDVARRRPSAPWRLDVCARLLAGRPSSGSIWPAPAGSVGTQRCAAAR